MICLFNERLYHSQLSDWRKEFELKGLSGLNKSAPGPKSKLTPEQKRIVQLEGTHHTGAQGLRSLAAYMHLQVSWVSGSFIAEQVFTGEFESIGKIKQQTLDAQYLLHPERFVKAPPKVAMTEEHVYINPII